MCESRTKRQFIPTKVVVTANIFLPFSLPRLPVVSVTKVENWDANDNVYTTVNASAYYLEGEEFVLKDYTYNSRYSVEYVAGYTELPEELKQAMLHELAYRYENRGNLNVKAGLHETTAQMLLPYMNLKYSL